MNAVPMEAKTPTPPPLPARLIEECEAWNRRLARVEMLHIAQGALLMAAGIGQVGLGVYNKDIALLAGGCLAAPLGVLWMKLGSRLSRRREGERGITMLLSCVGLLNFPIGTVLNAMALWVLIKTKHLFR